MHTDSSFKMAAGDLVACASLVLAPVANAHPTLSSEDNFPSGSSSVAHGTNNVDLIPTDIETGGINQTVRFDIKNGSFEQEPNGDVIIKDSKNEPVGKMISGDKHFATGGVANVSFEILENGSVLAHGKIIDGTSTRGMGPSCFGNILGTTAATGLLFTSATPATFWGTGLALTAWTGQYMNTVAACAG